MPRYFFDIDVGLRHARDDFGIELISADMAREQAAAVMPQIVEEAPRADWPERLTLTVRDEEGKLVFKQGTFVSSRSHRSS